MKVLLLILIIFPITIFGQITITDSDMPQLNGIYTRSIGNPGDVSNVELTGVNFTWDFSTLTPVQQITDTFVDVSSTPVAYQLFFNNGWLYPDHEATYGVKATETPSFIPQLTVEDAYNYFRSDAGAFVQVGFGSTINSLPTSTRYIPTDTMYNFPLYYGQTSQNNFAFDITLPGILYYEQRATRIDTVDGWGTLITPYGTFNVIRVKSTLEKTDSTYIDALSFGSTVPRPTEIEYKWLAAGEGIPVLQVNTTAGQVSRVEYKDTVQALSVITITNKEVNLYPNPASCFSVIEWKGNDDRTIEIYNASGAKVSTHYGSSPFHLNTSELPAGIYNVRVFNSSSQTTRQLILYE